jgi:hypothetical protein
MDDTTRQNTPPLYSGKSNSDPKAPAFKIGLLKDKLGTAPDFLEPMPADELAAWQGLDQR